MSSFVRCLVASLMLLATFSAAIADDFLVKPKPTKHHFEVKVVQ